MRLLLFFALIPVVVAVKCPHQIRTEKKGMEFSVQKIGELPVSASNGKNEGLAGPFSGIIRNKLIIAGGTNFPDKKPWEGGAKIFYDKIYLFEIGTDTLRAISQSVTLPEPMAYGASISLPQGILCIGGNGPARCSSKVFLIRWDQTDHKLIVDTYPELPVPLSFTTAVLSDNVIYVTGGSTSPNASETKNYFFRLGLSGINTPAFKWEKLPSYPGLSRVFGVSVAQSNGVRECIYLFSGRNLSNPDEPVVMNDGLVYDPALQKWDYIRTELPVAFPVMAGSAFPYGSDFIVFAGGVPDSTFYEEHQLKMTLSKAVSLKSGESIMRIKEELLRFYHGHKGFSSRIFMYNTITKCITEAGNYSSFCPVTTNAIPFRDGIIITCGEVKPGIRTPEIYRISLLQQTIRTKQVDN